jgi:hypothetical protein
MPRTKSDGLLRALKHLCPLADFAILHERPWHSLTFSGVQICVSITLQGSDHTDIASMLQRVLPEYAFEIHGQLVADIAVVQNEAKQSQSCLLVDALVLDD